MFTLEVRLGDTVARTITFLGLLAIFSVFSVLLSSDLWFGIVAMIGVLLLALLLLVSDLRLLAIGWLVGTPTLFIFANNVLLVIPGLRAERIFFALLLAVVLLRFVFCKDRCWQPIAIDKAILAFVAICLASLLLRLLGNSFATALEDLIFYFYGVFMPYLTFLVVRELNWTPLHFRILMNALVICGIYLSLVGFLQYWLKITFFMPINQPILPDRAQSTLANGGEYGMVMNAIILVTLFRYVQIRDALARAVLLGLLGMFAVALLICQTRSTWIGTLLSLLAVFIVDRRARPILTVLVALGVAGALASLPLLVNTEMLVSLTRRFNEIESIFNRVAVNATAFNIIADHPLFGTGFGRHTFNEAKLAYASTLGSVPAEYQIGVDVPHNEFLHLLILNGVAGFVPYLMIFRSAFRLLRDAQHAPLAQDSPIAGFAPYGIGLLLIVLLNGLSMDLIFFTFFQLLLFFVLGAYASCLTAADARRPEGARAGPDERGVPA